MELTVAQLDRAVGAMVGMAVGNALGAGYAFGPPTDAEAVQMRSGGLGSYGAGEWGDDTAMAIPLLEVLREGMPLGDQAAQDRVVARWAGWAQQTADVAPAVAEVFAAYVPEVGARSLRDAAVRRHARNPQAGNASLMRTTPIALGFLDDQPRLVQAARDYSDLTHADPVAGDACVLWNLAQRHAIIHGEYDLASGLTHLPEERQHYWEEMITQADVGAPEDFALRNGWVAHTLQTAWSAIAHGTGTGPQEFEAAVRRAVAAGGDTPTTAAVTGGLAGARWGVSAIPLQWRRQLGGWPGYRDRDLVWATREAVTGQERPDACHAQHAGDAVPHPFDADLLLGAVGACSRATAVVSLCELGLCEEPAVPAHDQVDVWLQDSSDPADNPHLEHVVAQSVDMLLRLRDEGHRVLLQSGQGHSRLALIAVAYGVRVADAPADEVLRRTAAVVAGLDPNPVFRELLRHWD